MKYKTPHNNVHMTILPIGRTAGVLAVVRQHKLQIHDKQENEKNFCNTNFIIDTFFL